MNYQPSLINRLLTWCVCASVLAGTIAAQDAKPIAQNSSSTSSAQAASRAEAVVSGRSAAQIASSRSSADAEQVVHFIDLLPADAYVIYGEVRDVETQLRSPLLAEVLAPMQRLGTMPTELKQVLDFAEANAELLGGARLMFVTEAARADLPPDILVLELSSVDYAQKLEAKLKLLLPNSNLRSATAARAEVPEVEKGLLSLPFSISRIGNLLLLTDTAFNFAKLKENQGEALAINAQFQNLHNRFASEAAFMFYNIKLQERVRAERRAAAAKADAAKTAGTIVEMPMTMNSEVPTAMNPESDALDVPALEGDDEIPEGTAVVTAPPALEAPTSVSESESIAGEETESVTQSPSPALELGSLLSSLLFSGIGELMIMPEAIGGALAIEGDALAVRVLFANEASVPLGPIPFLPVLISGDAYTTQAARFAPAAAELFASFSFDLPRIYDAFVESLKQAEKKAAEFRTQNGKSSNNSNQLPPATGTSDDKQAGTSGVIVGGGGGVSVAIPAGEPFLLATLSEFETLTGVSLREDVLPTIGSEVALAVASGGLVGDARTDYSSTDATNNSTSSTATASGESVPVVKSATVLPGYVVVVALRDRARLQSLMMRALDKYKVLLPIGQAGFSKQGNIEILNLSGGRLGLVDDYLVIASDAETMKRVAETHTNGNGLATQEAFIINRTWQSPSKLGEVYVAEHVIEELFGFTSRSIKQVAGSDIEPFFAQYRGKPSPLTYAFVPDGAGGMHEMRVPHSFLVNIAAQIAANFKYAPAINNETEAKNTLWLVHYTQSEFYLKNKRYASLQELREFDPTTEDTLRPANYRIEVKISGSGFQATAVPTNYPSGGRQSFFIDESGELRGADHAGRLATKSDPRLDF